MKNESKSKKIYIRSMDEWVTVPEEYFIRHVKEHDTFRKRMQERGECICPKSKWWLCDMDCYACEYKTNGRWLSMDMPMNVGDGKSTTLGETLYDDSPSIESVMADSLLIEQLLLVLEELDPEGKLICKSMMDGNSERKTARQLNIAFSTFQRRWAKLKKAMTERLKDYY